MEEKSFFYKPALSICTDYKNLYLATGFQNRCNKMVIKLRFVQFGLKSYLVTQILNICHKTEATKFSKIDELGEISLESLSLIFFWSLNQITLKEKVKLSRYVERCPNWPTTYRLLNFTKAINCTFYWFIGVITYFVRWGNTKKV